jgi:pimeloyl-ACP methyl ester carboxylesterase
MATFVVAHGAWSAGWAWKKMHPLMTARGHRLLTPSHTGLGERAHLAQPGVDLDTHIADILGVIEMEDLRGVILIGHSYGGMVATGVAARARDRIAKWSTSTPFARDGDSVFRLLQLAKGLREAVARRGLEDSQSRCRRHTRRRRPGLNRAPALPLKTFEQSSPLAAS